MPISNDPTTLIGTSGDDSLHTGNGNDSLDGKEGNDTLITGGGADTVTGGTGEDTLHHTFFTSVINNSLDLNTGSSQTIGDVTLSQIESVVLTFSNANDRFSLQPQLANTQINSLDMAGGNDTLTVSQGYVEAQGGEGTDHAIINLSASAEIISMYNFGSDNFNLSSASNNLNFVSFQSAEITTGSGADTLVGTSGNDTISAGNGVNYVYQSDGDDSLVGGDAYDFLLGGEGSDTLNGSEGDDDLLGGEGNDSYVAGLGNDNIYDDGGDDIIDAGAGNDNIYTDTGSDTIRGGSGFDFLRHKIVDSPLNITLDLNSAIDNNVGNILINSIEQVDLTLSTHNDILTFNSNHLAPAGTRNTINANAGNDTLTISDGSLDIDAGEGVDFLSINLALNTQNVSNNHYTATTVQYTFGSETILIKNNESVSIATGTGADSILGYGSADTISTGSGNDSINGLGNDDSLSGGEGDDSIVADVGNDTIDGGSGEDKLWSVFEGAAINEEFNANAAGTQIFSNQHISAVEHVDFVLTTQNDTLIFTGYATTHPSMMFSDSINLNSGNDTLTFTSGSAYLYGGEGNDNLVIDRSGSTASLTSQSGQLMSDNISVYHFQFEHLNITAGQAADYLEGMAQSDTIYGNAGDDTLKGQGGSDYLSAAQGNDLIETGGGSDTVAASSGNDTITDFSAYGGDKLDMSLYNIASYDVIRYIQASNGGFSSLKFDAQGQNAITFFNVAPGALGSASYLYSIENNDEVWNGTSDAEVIFSGAGNDTLFAHEGNDTLFGDRGDDSLSGGDGNDNIYGNEGQDTLEGGSGTNTLVGGMGNDLYIITSTGGSVYEQSGAGVDTVWSYVDTTLGVNLENATLMSGAGHLRLIGNMQDNQLTGNEGHNTLNGQQGQDTLIGGAGNDVYVVDHTQDQTFELAGDGIDTIQTTLGNWTLAANTENLIFSMALEATGSGNSENNMLTGNTLSDNLSGGDGHDSLNGNAGDDILIGGGGHDLLNGSSGNDSLTGGAGNDSYYIDSLSDSITELDGEGTDLVCTSVSLNTLAAFVENVTLLGTGDMNLGANSLNNLISANTGNNSLSAGDGDDVIDAKAGADTLNGGRGADTLTGGAGQDVFVFEESLEGRDRIRDFNVTDDQLQITASNFGGGLIAGGALTSNQLVQGTVATQAYGQFIFNAVTNVLWWDADGIGAGSAVSLATFDNKPSLTHMDFELV